MTTGREDWTLATLGDLLTIKHGFAFKGEHFSDHGEYVVVTPGNFKAGGGFKRKNDGQEKYYSAEPPADFILGKGDLILALTDLTQDAPILGSPAIVPAANRYLHNQRIGKVVGLDEARADPDYIYYLFCAETTRAQIRATATGATVRHTAPKRIYDIEVPLPPPRTQRRIALLLSTYDDLIENNTRRFRILEEMAQTIYREWFVEFRFPGHLQVPFEESVTGPIPEGWAVRPLSEVVSTSRRTIDPRRHPDEYFAHFSIPAFDGVREPTIEAGSAIRSSKLELNEPCVLYGKLNPRISRAWLTRPHRNLRSIASTEFVILAPSAPAWSLPLIWAVCSSPEFAGRVAGMAVGTSTSHQRVKIKDLMHTLVVEPEMSVGKAFAHIAGDMLDLANNLRAASENLRATRDLLLPRLVSGELDVSRLDIEEPGLVA